MRIIIAGGGTGGHLFPGVAIGREILRRYEKSHVLFITGSKKIEEDILARSGFQQESISIEGIKGHGWGKGIITMCKLPMSLFQSARIIKRLSPHIVIGVGGYSSGPACIAAKLMGVPTAIQEQNSFPGITNRILSRVVDRIFISFDVCREYFPEGNIFLTGNPIRKEFQEKKPIEGTKENLFSILVAGGSQGASAINSAMIETLEILKKNEIKIKIIHQTGQYDFERVQQEYREKGLQGEVVPFIKEMAKAYREADIVVGRAGAMTISELAVLGKPSILIPYPFATNNHQETNAQILVKLGGARMISQKELNGKMLSEILIKYIEDKSALKKMGVSAKKAARPDAVKDIVDLMEDLKNKNIR